ncbi:hypothetical protein KTN05_10365 [Paracoccus sp. Z118]|uniref:hypothetical protein n=1 Tax=Paracoccus sp. Z118 TaxID=2851017 RepID=UPI001C2C8CF9|nr:hypothetical protein [Paracoccus sp. Z118]MBV0892256.1 hypothetical protein [Paracoccus sp. Z118]
MTNNEIRSALTNATEIEKAELAQFLLEALGPHGLMQDEVAKHVIVGALDRFAAPEGGQAQDEDR